MSSAPWVSLSAPSTSGACRAALAAGTALAAENAARQAAGLEPIRVRIGIHSGPAFRVVFLNDQVLRGRAAQTAVYRLIGMSGIGMSGIGSGGAQEVGSVDR